MPNTIARPMSPAVGVNYDRNHMREIYQKKSIAYKCLKRCMDIFFIGPCTDRSFAGISCNGGGDQIRRPRTGLLYAAKSRKRYETF